MIDCPVHQLHSLKGERPEDFRKSFQLAADGTIKFRCRRSIRCRRHSGDIDNSFQKYNEALTYFENRQNKKEIAWINVKLGTLALHRAQYSEAEQYFTKALRSPAQEIHDALFNTYVLDGMGTILL